MSKTTLWLGVLLLACGKVGDGLVPVSSAGGSGTVVSASGAGGDAADTHAMSGNAGTAGTAGNAPACPKQAFPIGGGLCRCVSALPDVCPDTCTDLTGDPENCGSCGKRCGPSSTCVNSACGPAPSTVLPPRPDCGALHLALGGGRLFWSDPSNGQIMSMPTPAGAAVLVADKQGTPTLLAIFGTTLFWLNSGTNTLMKASIAGGAPNAVFTSGTAIHGFTVSADSSTLYFSSENHVYKVPTDGGLALDVVDQDFNQVPSGVPYALALDGDVLAYAVDLDGSVNAISLTAKQPTLCDDSVLGPPCRLARAYGLVPDSIFALNGRAYWADNVEGAVVSSVTVAGQFTREAVARPIDFEQITALTIQGASAFFAAGGDVYTSPLLANSTSIPVARNQAPMNSLVADGANLYWSTWQATGPTTQGGTADPTLGTCAIERISY